MTFVIIKFHIIHLKPRETNSGLCSNVSNTDFKSESHTHGAVSFTKLQISVSFNVKNISLK